MSVYIYYKPIKTKKQMKSVIVKNLQIQFDSFHTDKNMSNVNIAIETLDAINRNLQECFPDICPQIFVNAINDSDIEIADCEDDIPEHEIE